MSANELNVTELVVAANGNKCDRTGNDSQWG